MISLHVREIKNASECPYWYISFLKNHIEFI